ncbi:hypothetical protein DJ568_11695 [Mucilaginibacter hurinus]|uniref:Uncharacterized protein n=1 Tax=Mucilaginibacter hurinus TaxID=2201324 RepID=A0A367GMD2_9SPHI|nr:putative glycolipid-binding domain-containing protein [Mucilaginibacter hurinus]RCH54480.1 hypothetical protein DJ568_11695 [Mucilaginibacter hurinus]
MVHQLSWQGNGDFVTLENCTITIGHDSIYIESLLKGVLKALPFNAAYHITTDSQWRTMAFTIDYTWGNDTTHLNYSSDTQGNWLTTSKEQPQLTGCIEIDFTATPFTNTLAINRLNLTIGQSTEIKVLYIDVEKDTVSSTRQIYTRIDQSTYHFATEGFESEFSLMSSGLLNITPGCLLKFKLSITPNINRQN